MKKRQDFRPAADNRSVLSVGDGLLGVLVKDVELVEVEAYLDVIADLRGGGRINTGGNGLTGDRDIEVDLCAHELGYVNVGVEEDLSLLDLLRLVVNVLGTDAEYDFLAYISVELAVLALIGGDRNSVLVEVEGVVVALLADGGVDEVHLG